MKARQTKKYVRAVLAARERGISPRGIPPVLYERLRKAGLQWDPEMGLHGGWYVAAERFDPTRIRQVQAAARAREAKARLHAEKPKAAKRRAAGQTLTGARIKPNGEPRPVDVAMPEGPSRLTPTTSP